MKVNKGLILKISFLFVFILVLSTIKVSDPDKEYTYIDTDVVPLGTYMDASVPGQYPINILPLYKNAEITKIINFNADGYVLFSTTKDSMKNITEYYDPYINAHEIICESPKGRLRALGATDQWIFIITTRMDLVATGEHDSQIKVDIAEFKKVDLNDPMLSDAFIEPSKDHVGLYNTSASVAGLVSYYATYDEVSDVLLVNYETIEGEAIMFKYENGFYVLISGCNLNEQTQNFNCQVEIKEAP